MSEILDRLYLSSVRYAKDPSFVKNTAITHILIAAKSLTHYFPKIITYLQFPITDSPSTLIIAFFPEAIQFIESALQEKNNNVLVHCLGGRSRSVTIMTSYLMFKLKMNREEALEFIKKKHTLAFPNAGFLAQLKLFEICLEKYFKENLIEEMKGINFEENKDEEECKMDLNKIKPKEKKDLIFESLDLIVKRKIEKNYKK